MTRIASVVLDEGLDRQLDYAIPPSLDEIAHVGKRVKVPVRTSFRLGTIMGIEEKTSSFSLKPIAEILSDTSFIQPALFRLGEWMAEYYCCSLRKILRLFLPPSIRKGMAPKITQHVIPAFAIEDFDKIHAEMQKKSPGKARLLQALKNSPDGMPLSSLLLQASANRSSYKSLLDQGLVRSLQLEKHRDPLELAEFLPTQAKVLSPEQHEALSKITASLDAEAFATHLLFGITGSGKTEVYLQAIEHALLLKKSTIFLVPEIALTSQTVERIRSRFRDQVALLHHRLSEGEKRDAWHAIHRGDIRIVLGPRSSIFAPIPSLGLIIIDEEHEGAYKQTDESPCYHARDVSIMRGKLENATVVLGSATPTLETYYNALEKKYILSRMINRPENAKLPSTHIIDMRLEAQKKKGSVLFSDPLLSAIGKRLERGEQSLLFLNRRGYHSSRLCASCGETIKCPHCDLSLTFHKKENQLVCHLCQFQTTPPDACPHCGKSEGQKYQGAGTEQVERALHAIFPESRILRLDADTTKRKGSHEQAFKQFRSGKADILVGTQMIAKGLHFPNVTLVGALNADSGLHVPDFRSSERVFQLVTQVAGRAGRSGLAGEVFIQSWLPEHPAIALAAQGRYEDFFIEELETRRLFNYPPFIRLVKVVLSGENPDVLQNALEKFRQYLIQNLPPAYALLPVTPCGYAKVKGHFRFQIIVKGPSCLPVSRLLKDDVARRLVPTAARIFIDCDPISTFF